ncbi:hypothetical protein I5677_07070 [Mobilitalea sibirica]|uniref:DUF5704 domain-containing protein n=1 Tax=Mobilitalea sibirica TaxID=1462919 RepID=A0A8J7HB38_9FIRM|nr:DUF5704 domain-containing protein [Mobilitalea sibirica]MBH1940646.1 hypothetical protein [Mobilitalea sibirica]
MIFIQKQKNFCRGVSVLVILCILIGSYDNPFLERARAADTWMELDGLPNGIQKAEIKDEQIVQTGIHNAADKDLIRYKTKYYYMAIETFDIYQRMSSTRNSGIETKLVNFRYGRTHTVDNLKSVEYIIDRKEFTNAAAKLGVTADSIIRNGGSQTVYMNNIFDIVQGEDDRVLRRNVFGYTEMMNAIDWSSATDEYLKGYYNFPYKITAGSIYDVKIKAVDEARNELKDLTPNDTKYSKAIYSQKWPSKPATSYELPQAEETIVKNNVNHQFKKEWYYEYTRRGTGEKVTMPVSPVSNNQISIASMPDADELTIYFVYKKSTKPYYYQIDAVDETGKYLRTNRSKTLTHFGDTSVFYRPLSPITVNKKEYNYQNKWEMVYIDRVSGTEKKITRTGATIDDITMPDAKEDSIAVFKVVFSTGATPTLPPTPTPRPGVPSPTPTPAIPIIEVPLLGAASMEFTQPVNTGMIRADLRGAERFTAPLGVPTTESLFAEVIAKEYLVGYRFVKKIGIEHYNIKVTKDYILSYMTATPEEEGGGEPVTETITVTHHVTVPRAYGYWEIENLEVYKIDNAHLTNYALPGGSITLYPNMSYYNPPTISYNHSSSKEYHIIKPNEAINGITLPSETISVPGDPTSRPNIPREEFERQAEYTALTQTGKIKVRSDSVIFNDQTVISDAIRETEAPDINPAALPQCYTNINKNVLYRSGMVIDATKKNGTYPSSGTITYTALARVGTNRAQKPSYMINNLNQVVIHSPVVCEPILEADNDRYVQLLNPMDGCTQLVLDPDQNLSDFTVTISNTGPHSGKLGYYTRDFSRSLRDPNVSYIASSNGILRNEVQFPFDVYLDIGADKDPENDTYVTAGTWVVIGRSSPRFYLPMWTEEGVHTINFRTVAVNGEPYIERTEEYANRELIRYVATNTRKVEVSGRMYGLNIYDLTDYPLWEEAFRVPKSKDFKKNYPDKYLNGTDKPTYNKNYSYTYTIGTNDQYGNDTGRKTKFTLPLVNGSHPYYKNLGVLKSGYMFRYSLETTGNLFSDANMVLINPSFYFVDKNGENRTAVDLYYTEEINRKNRHLVKMGSSLDKINMKTTSTGDIYLGIPEDELRQTAALRNTNFGKHIAKRAPMFTFTDIRLNYAFRTYVNDTYMNTVKGFDSFTDVLDRGIEEDDITICKQRWYGEYYLPNEVHAVAKGFDVYDYMDKYGVDYSEDFWLTDGYIIINFSIETLDQNGNCRLSYTNALNYMDKGHCSMWIMEGPVPTKKDWEGTSFNFFAGDVIMYYADKQMTDDYSPGVIY